MMLGGAEIRLADAEIDDVAALRGERGGARQHREGVLLADAIEGRDGVQHGIRSLTAVCIEAKSLDARNASLPVDAREQ